MPRAGIGWDGYFATCGQKARAKYPKFEFFTCDVGFFDNKYQSKFDVIILSQMLWYVLDDLTNVFENLSKYLREDGHLVITQAFFKGQQKYGREIMTDMTD